MIGNYLVSINDSKNGLPRKFLVGPPFYEQVKSYISLRPEDFDSGRFFVQFLKGKCTPQPIGKNKIGQIPRIIAEFLKLANPERYTGQCLRRTSATLLSNSGASITMLKQLGGWKSVILKTPCLIQKIFNKITHADQVVPPSDKNLQQFTSKTNPANSETFIQNDQSVSTETNDEDCLEEIVLDATLTICTIYDAKNLYIYDSTNNKTLNSSQKIYLERLYHDYFENKKPIHFLKVQQQPNGLDCGVFAIAFATSLAFNEKPENLIYDYPLIRKHLLEIFKSQTLPLISDKHTKLQLSTLDVLNNNEKKALSMRLNRLKSKNNGNVSQIKTERVNKNSEIFADSKKITLTNNKMEEVNKKKESFLMLVFQMIVRIKIFTITENFVVIFM
ncbi:uncharacterized protein [Chelonus insularis]|uniref:uncharacterized protein n=1 Tax=Chelonus insularis TaxID=460826 RepID=UPI001589A3AB|nr:uncharacterized protein LOC118069893 [Chelonus insularis]